MTTNKPEIFAYRRPSGYLADITTHPEEYEPLIRLSDYEALQAECAQLRAAIRRLCNIYVVGDDYYGQLREDRLESAVNRAIDATMEDTNHE